jgi:hypothetical protein
MSLSLVSIAFADVCHTLDAQSIATHVAERVAAVSGSVRLDLEPLFDQLSLREMAHVDQADGVRGSDGARVPILAEIAATLAQRGVGGRVAELALTCVCQRSLQALFRSCRELRLLRVAGSSDEFESLEGVDAPALTELSFAVEVAGVEVFSDDDAHNFPRLYAPLLAVVKAAPTLHSLTVSSFFGCALGVVPYAVARAAPSLRSLTVSCPDAEGTGEFNLRMSSREWRAFLAACPVDIEHIAFHGLHSALSTADMALLLRCTPQLRSLEMLTEAQWPEQIMAQERDREDRARPLAEGGDEDGDEDGGGDEDEDEHPPQQRRRLLSALGSNAMLEAEELLAQRNHATSTSLQRLAVVGCAHATVEQVLLPLIRASAIGVESVRVWLGTSDAKRVVLEALTSGAGAVRDVVVPHSALDGELVLALAAATRLERLVALKPAFFAFEDLNVVADEPAQTDVQLLISLLRTCTALRELVLTATADIAPTAALMRAVGELAHLRVFGWQERQHTQAMRVFGWQERQHTQASGAVADVGADVRAVLHDATLFRSLQYAWFCSESLSASSPLAVAMREPDCLLSARCKGGSFRGLSMLTSAVRMRWHDLESREFEVADD